MDCGKKSNGTLKTLERRDRKQRRTRGGQEKKDLKKKLFIRRGDASPGDQDCW
jgi:hypothetical protein